MPNERMPDECCPIHQKKLPCFSCRAAKGGRVRSARKTAENRKKARRAAMMRWHRVAAEETAE